jgi:prepilin-type N-terminal cleavage/methylation domain-containing protein
MQQTLKEKIQAKLANSEGFTLLEILVVLTIMGFLIAMVAPRLAGISGSAVDTVCDSNQNRMISMMSSFYEKTNRYPDKLTNIVEETAAGVYQVPAISDDDPDNGAETIASEFNDRNHFRIHYLSEAEVRELKQMGIVNVFNLNSYDAYNEDGTAFKAGYNGLLAPNEVPLAATVTKAPTMEKFTLNPNVVANPIAVMMVGAGVDGTGAWEIPTEERGWGEGDFIGRMVFGFGPENALVTSGLVSNAAHCPGGIQNTDNVTYNDYNLVLPRLASTANAAYETAFATVDADSTDGTIQIAAISYNEDNEPSAAYDYVGNADNYKTRLYDLTAMDSFQYATMCPEGHKFPADDGDFWGLDLNPTAGAGGPTAGTLD